MILGLCLILVTALVWTITSSASRPRSTTVPGDSHRRTSQLRVCPDRVTQPDLERLLAQRLGSATVARVVGLGAERRVPVRTMWGFAERFGADKLVLALDAEVPERSMRRHVEAGTVPDWRAMTMFATLNRELPQVGVPLDRTVDLDAAPQSASLSLAGAGDGWSTPALQPIDLSGFGDLPPISGPGLHVTLDDEDDWPIAA
ncbi:hypothetical protein ABLE68_18505 [Nocardioides sp. CN2-186]|uniref:hypothetical protein n=1 Tax=Nocardioides tweenelious TaxID=3156607 RepID=UPI0032B6103C